VILHVAECIITLIAVVILIILCETEVFWDVRPYCVAGWYCRGTNCIRFEESSLVPCEWSSWFLQLFCKLQVFI